MDLREARIGEERTTTIRTVGRGHVATHRVGREVKSVPVASARQDHRISRVGLDFPGHHVAGDDSLSVAVDQDEIEHLVARMHFYRARGNLMAQFGVDP